MKTTLTYCLLACFALFFVYSCKKGDGIKELKKSCLYSSKDDFFKKWGNTYTQIDVYTGTTLKTKKLIYPYGYFKMNTDLTYDVLSDGIPHSGSWNVTDSCELVLDKYIPSLKRTFEVVKINSDSLVIRRKSRDTVYTQHYAAFVCPAVAKLQVTWDNTFIRTDYFNNTRTAIDYATIDRPVGYFKINTDGSYNVVSNGVPHDGTWKFESEGCRITLDAKTSVERTFDIMQFSKDTLTIWRKDPLYNSALTQQYKKH